MVQCRQLVLGLIRDLAHDDNGRWESKSGRGIQIPRLQPLDHGPTCKPCLIIFLVPLNVRVI